MKFMNHAVGNTRRQKYENQAGPKIKSNRKKTCWRRLQTLAFCQCDIAAANCALDAESGFQFICFWVKEGITTV